MPNPKSKKDLEDLINLCKEEKCELQSLISRSKERIKELDAKIEKASKELNGQIDLFEGLM
jgi:uncharacterized protein YhaN